VKKKPIPDGEYYVADDPSLRLVVTNGKFADVYCLDGRDPYEALDAALSRLIDAKLREPQL